MSVLRDGKKKRRAQFNEEKVRDEDLFETEKIETFPNDEFSFCFSSHIFDEELRSENLISCFVNFQSMKSSKTENPVNQKGEIRNFFPCDKINLNASQWNISSQIIRTTRF